MTEPPAFRLWASSKRHVGESSKRLAPLAAAEPRLRAHPAYTPHYAKTPSLSHLSQRTDPQTALAATTGGLASEVSASGELLPQAQILVTNREQPASVVHSKPVPLKGSVDISTTQPVGAAVTSSILISRRKTAEERTSTPRNTVMTTSFSRPAAFDIASAAATDFSAHAHAVAILQRQAPQLMQARDADTALAALDAVESAIRQQRDAARREEGEARDALRRALQSSSKTKANAMLDADQAEQSLAFVTEMAKTASRTLSALVDPFRVAKNDKAQLKTANELFMLLVGQSKVDIVRAAELLAIAKEALRSDDQAIKLFDADVEILELARVKLTACIHDLQCNLTDAVVRGAVTMDASTIRTCMAAAAFLGRDVESSVTDAVVDAFASAGDAPHSSPPSRILHRHVRQGLGPSPVSTTAFPATTNSFGKLAALQDENDLTSNRGAQLHPNASNDIATDGDNFNVSKTVTPVRTAHAETLRIVEEFIVKVKLAFPDPASACLRLVQKLVEVRIAGAAAAVLDELEHEVNLRDAAVEAAMDKLAEKKRDPTSSSSPIATVDARRAFQRSSVKAAAAKKHYLDSLALLSSLTAVAENDLYSMISSFNVPSSSFYNTINVAHKPLQRHFAHYYEMESRWIDRQVRAAFADVDRMESQAPGSPQSVPFASEAYHRYRIYYLHIASRFPQMTKVAIRSCLESLRRCFLRFVAPEPSDNNGYCRQLGIKTCTIDRTANQNCAAGSGDPSETSIDYAGGPGELHCASRRLCMLLHDLCDNLQSLHTVYSGILLAGAKKLLPENDVAAGQPEIWSSGSSPLAAYCKVIRYLLESNNLLDMFFDELEVSQSASTHKISKDVFSDFSKSIDVGLSDVFKEDARVQLRAKLRSDLHHLATDAQSGIQVATCAVGARLLALIDTEETNRMYSVPDVKLDDSSSQYLSNEDSSFPINVEPSMPFVTASAFLEQQLSVVRSSLTSPNLEFTVALFVREVYDTVLQCWRSLDGVVTVTGGLQMTADGRAIAQVLEPFGKENDLWRLPAMGQVFLSTLSELSTVIETEPLARADATVLVHLLKKREDADDATVVAICASLTAALSLEEVSSAFDL